MGKILPVVGYTVSIKRTYIKSPMELRGSITLLCQAVEAVKSDVNSLY
jgi:hypothetical protein